MTTDNQSTTATQPSSRDDLYPLAYGILIPELPGLTVTDPIRDFLGKGGQAVLFGETRSEYLARSMSDDRRATESASDVIALTTELTRIAGKPIAVAMDQEIAGINRLHDMVSPLPTRDEFLTLSTESIERVTEQLGKEMRALGVTMNFAPVLDVMTGPNGWLDRRAYGPDENEVARIGSAFTRGQVRGGITVVAKHFPGHRGAHHDPAIEPGEVVPNIDGTERDLLPFRSVIAAGVPGIMLGPAIIEAIDPIKPSSRSSRCVELLRRELGFEGLAVTDDLNSRSNSRDDSVATAAVDALKAGADLLLVTGQVTNGDDLSAVADALVDAVDNGTIPVERLVEAYNRVVRVAIEPSRV
ncbi:beta-N-acetylhexosaminidase [Rhodococcus sp. 27YEA15]|uniref:glycoside hydrolase family 3 N-terminal domain-containing protein n=1 Tax=Rhodococcus sp. 27YEA15 TaxID=3156259 RepID=UPI003C7AE499